MGTAALILLGISLGFALGYGTGRVRSDARVFRAGHAAGWDARDGLDQFDPDHPVVRRGPGHPANRERGATLPTHALVIAVLVGAWMLSGYLFGGWGS